ncbi:MAG: 3D domain-containing protein [Bacillota bacterium]
MAFRVLLSFLFVVVLLAGLPISISGEGNFYLLRSTVGFDFDAVGDSLRREKEVQEVSRAVSQQQFFMEATAYTYTGQDTASGVPPRPGVVAVDPEVIPLGTELYVEDYGPAVALDTGGDIKGYRIDVFMESKQKALAWGRRQVRVWVYK